LVVAQQVPRSLGGLEDRLDEPWAGLEAPLLEPVGDVRCSAHEADRDLLPAPEGARRNPAVDAIGEPLVALLHRLDDRGGVDAGRGAERVAPDQRIVERDVPAHGARHGLAVLDERGQIALRGQLAEEPQVEQEGLDGGVADALAESPSRRAPCSSAVRKSGLRASGGERVLYSVTYATGGPALTARLVVWALL